MNQKDTIDLQINDAYLVIGKAQFVRILGILTVLNGLVYALFDKLKFYFNRRFKYFGIVLFFLSLMIIANGVMFFSESNGLGGGLLFSLNNNNNSIGFLLVMAGFVTLLFSLFMPLVIWMKITLKNIFSKK